MKCEHTGCTCEATSIEKNDRKYCSEHCAEADAQGHRAPACGCGHSGCKGLGSSGRAPAT